MIDDDGDPTTVDDRHTLESEWDFSGDFGTAEVVSSNPTSSGSDPASWFIDYEGVTRVVITDLGRDGFTLIDIECVAQSDSQEWEVDGSSVIWFPPWQAFGPSSFACEFIHSPTDSPTEPVSARVTAHPMENLPGDPTGQEAGLFLPAEFVADFGAAQVDAAQPVADQESLEASWMISYASDTRITLTERVPSGYELLSVGCDRYVDGPDGISFEEVPVERDGNSVSFTVEVVTADQIEYMCAFRNRVAESAGLPTLPPTDAGGQTARRVGNGPPVLLLLLAAAVSMLVLGLSRRDSSSRSTR